MTQLIPDPGLCPRAMNRGLFVAAILWAAMVVFTVHFIHFPGSVPDFTAATGGGTMLDVSPSFSVDEVYKRLTGYGEQGRHNYVFRNWTVDLLLPLSVLPFFFLLMLRATGRISLQGGTRLILLSVPFSYVVFDLVENGAVLILLANFPNRIQSVAAALPYVTIVKRAASLLAFFIPLLIYGFLLVRGWSARVSRSDEAIGKISE